MQRATEKGARVLFRNVSGIVRAGNRWKIHTSDDAETYESVHVVLAAGSDSVPLAENAGIHLPITARHRRLAYSVPHREQILAPLITSHERGFVGRQLAEGVFFLGWMDETTEDDDAVFVERALKAGASLMPIFEELPIRRVVHGIYDSTPDHRPILGSVAGADGLWLAVGFSGHGFMISPAVGELIAKTLIGKKSELPLAPFSLARFAHLTRSESLVI
jgi:sarcosine oxidase subunit beta